MKEVSCHGLALLLGLGPVPVMREPVCCIDVRRADERTLYGCIPGESWHQSWAKNWHGS